MGWMQVTYFFFNEPLDSGHYYSFIYDFYNSKWRRYNETNIREETEQQVFLESIGGYG